MASAGADAEVLAVAREEGWSTAGFCRLYAALPLRLMIVLALKLLPLLSIRLTKRSARILKHNLPGPEVYLFYFRNLLSRPVWLNVRVLITIASAA